MGKIYGIVGRNGSGKTVLLKCICGLLYPQAGTVTVGGKVVGKDVDYPENVGFIIETPGFLPRYSGLKNLKYLASVRGKVKEDEIRKYMELVGLNPDDKKQRWKLFAWHETASWNCTGINGKPGHSYTGRADERT